MVADVDEAVEGYLSSTADPSFKRLVLLRQGIDRAVCREQIPSQVFIGRLSYRRDPVRGGGAVVIRTACERSIAMSKVVAIMSMSLDGYAATMAWPKCSTGTSPRGTAKSTPEVRTP